MSDKSINKCSSKGNVQGGNTTTFHDWWAKLNQWCHSCSVPATSAMNPSSPAGSGSRCSIKLKDLQQLVISASSSATYLQLAVACWCSASKEEKIPYKNFRWTDFGWVYIPIYPPSLRPWCQAVQTLVNCRAQLEGDALRDIQPMQLIVQGLSQTPVELPCAGDDSGGSI